MEIAMSCSDSRPVKPPQVNCVPWSVLKIRGAWKFASASVRASMQNEASSVLESRQESTRRDAQSMTATR